MTLRRNNFDVSNTVDTTDHASVNREIDRIFRELFADAGTQQLDRCFSDVVRLYRGEELDLTLGGEEAGTKIQEVFGKKSKYSDVPGLCKAATLKEIEAQGLSLNPGRYVGVAPGEVVSDEDFKEQLETLNEELETLNAQARELESTIAKNVAEVLEA